MLDAKVPDFHPKVSPVEKLLDEFKPLETLQIILDLQEEWQSKTLRARLGDSEGASTAVQMEMIRHQPIVTVRDRTAFPAHLQFHQRCSHSSPWAGMFPGETQDSVNLHRNNNG